jgi:hypothetical protein
MKKHFVEFYSPRTFFAETSTRAIESWNVDKAVAMAADIKERYDATPYAFRFITRERKDDELDSRVVERSGYYFLGGSVMTLEELEFRNDPEEEILRRNMRIFGFEDLFYYPVDATQSLRALKVDDHVSVQDFDKETRVYVVREIHPFGLITELIEGKSVHK